MKYQLYIRSSEVKSNDLAISGEVNTPFSDDAATAIPTLTTQYNSVS